MPLNQAANITRYRYAIHGTEKLPVVNTSLQQRRAYLIALVGVSGAVELLLIKSD